MERNAVGADTMMKKIAFALMCIPLATVALAQQVPTPLNAVSGGTQNHPYCIGSNKQQPTDCGAIYYYYGGTSGGSANAQTVTASTPTGYSLTPGVTVNFQAGYSNTGTATLAVSGGTALALRVNGPSGLAALGGGELVAGNRYIVALDASSTHWVVTNPSVTLATVTCADLPALTGDTTTSAGSCATTTAKVDGVSYPASPSTNTVPVVTGTNTVSYETVPVLAGGTGATTASGALTNLGALPLAGGTMTGTEVLAAGSLSAPSLSISGTGTGLYQNGTNNPCWATNATLTWCTTNYQTFFGETGSSNIGGVSGQQVEIAGTHQSLNIGYWANNTTGTSIYLMKSRGTTVGSHGAVQTGDALGNWVNWADDGTTFAVAAAKIYSQVTGTVSTGIVPSELGLQTMNSSGTLTNALVLDQSQNLNVGSAGTTKIADSTGDLFGKYGLFTGTTAPTLANGNAAIYGSTTAGGVLSGEGSVSDLTLANNAGTAALSIPTGTTNLVAAGTLKTPAGSASAPALEIGSTNYGIYLPSSTILGFTTNGTQAGTVTNTQHWFLGNGQYQDKYFGSYLPTLLVNGATDNINFGGGVSMGHWAANGTFASPTTVANTNVLDVTLAGGYDGTSYQAASAILTQVTGTVSTGIVPGKLIFRTANTSGTLVTGLAIDQAQNLRVGSGGTILIADASGNLYGGSITPGTLSAGTGSFLCGASNTAITTEATTCVASDSRVKHDIAPLGDVLAKIMDKPAVRFSYDEGKGAPGRRIGTIADAWDTDFPELVDRDPPSEQYPDGLRHFDYAAFSAVLLSAVQQEKRQIETLWLAIYILGGWSGLLSVAVAVLFRRKPSCA